MSFQNKGLWLLKGNGNLTDDGLSDETSLRVEQKRSHQFLTDAFEGELFSNKKQAVQAVSDAPSLIPASLNFSFWGNSPNLQSTIVPSSDRSRAPEPLGTFSVGDKGIFSLGNENAKSERNSSINILQNNSTVSLSMSHAGEVPFYANATREARVNLAEKCTSDYPFPLWNSSNTGEDSINATSLGLTYSAGIGNVISMGLDFAKEELTASPIDNTINKVSGNCRLMGHQYSMGDCNPHLMDQSLGKGNSYYNRTENPPYKENDNFMPIPPNSKAHENFLSMLPSYGIANENFMPVGLPGDEDFSIASRCPTPDKAVEAVISAGTCSKENSSITSVNKGEMANIAFGGVQHEPDENNPSHKAISSYGLMIGKVSPEASELLTERSTVEHSAAQIETVDPETTFRRENVSKQKVQKAQKSSPNNFPTNVKNLLSTGILDGVPVKYVSWSREKTVRGVIKGTGYLCGCNDCKLSKCLNAYEFERHAACKTKHPNNHIYLENGKTIYAAVQELKSTPQDMLFEAIQNITGSSINQKNFQIWKASYQAASRELHRIYGNGEVAKPT